MQVRVLLVQLPDQERAQFLNGLMMLQETGFKDTSVVSSNTCAVHRFLYPLHNPAQLGPCAVVDSSLYSEIVCGVELLSPLYGI